MSKNRLTKDERKAVKQRRNLRKNTRQVQDICDDTDMDTARKGPRRWTK